MLLTKLLRELCFIFRALIESHYQPNLLIPLLGLDLLRLHSSLLLHCLMLTLLLLALNTIERRQESASSIGLQDVQVLILLALLHSVSLLHRMLLGATSTVHRWHARVLIIESVLEGEATSASNRVLRVQVLRVHLLDVSLGVIGRCVRVVEDGLLVSV